MVDPESGYRQLPLVAGSALSVVQPSGMIVDVYIDTFIADANPDYSNKIKLKTSLYNSNYHLNWHNCYSFGNGVESDRIRDLFNDVKLEKGAKASTTLDQPYKEERRKSSLIFSEIYNSTHGTNDTNQFLIAENITKDLNPTYGSIQRLWSQATAEGNLIAMCEDRILNIQANKDALFNADGSSNVVATNRVLGVAVPYAGNFGISKNPESFASESYRAYFSDKVRGSILRLSMDGLTPISDAGMKSWFRDNLELSNRVIGSYDDRKGEYNVKLEIPNTMGYSPNEVQGIRDFINNTANKVNKPKEYSDNEQLLEKIESLLSENPFDNKLVTYNEKVKGWVSFRSFVQEAGLTVTNTYFTFRNGELYSHDNETRNNFYTQQHGSFINAIFNDIPTSVKNFNTLNYSGDLGWLVDSIETDIESGNSSPFVTKENKHFSHIYNDNEANDTSSFSFQGIGTADNIDI